MPGFHFHSNVLLLLKFRRCALLSQGVPTGGAGVLLILPHHPNGRDLAPPWVLYVYDVLVFADLRMITNTIIIKDRPNWDTYRTNLVNPILRSVGQETLLNRFLKYFRFSLLYRFRIGPVRLSTRRSSSPAALQKFWEVILLHHWGNRNPFSIPAFIERQSHVI